MIRINVSSEDSNLSNLVAAVRTLASLSVNTAATSERRRDRCCSSRDGFFSSSSLRPVKELSFTLPLKWWSWDSKS